MFLAQPATELHPVHQMPCFLYYELYIFNVHSVIMRCIYTNAHSSWPKSYLSQVEGDVVSDQAKGVV